MRAYFFVLLPLISCTKAPNTPTPSTNEAQMLSRLKDSDYMRQAQTAFNNICSRCHGRLAEGGIGPNLTDKYWIHGDGKIMNLVTTIQQGAPDKGMPAWEAIVTQEEIELTAVYVFSLVGSQPAGAKAPQGNLKEN